MKSVYETMLKGTGNSRKKEGKDERRDNTYMRLFTSILPYFMIPFLSILPFHT